MSAGPGQVLGRAGGGLTNASWAANSDVARIGQEGELRTAGVLAPLAAANGGPTVLHDLAIPIPGISANIDHAVVSGNKILLLDSKKWAPGFYWTLGGLTRRGLKTFPAADKKTMEMAAKAVDNYLSRRRIRFTIAQPALVVWPSRASPASSFWALKTPGATAMSGAMFTLRARRLCGTKPADPAIVHALNGLRTDLRTRQQAA